jgi:putative nucleotidyltransferase with HDIG domain
MSGSPRPRLSVPARLYVTTVTAAGILAVALSAAEVADMSLPRYWYWLVALTLVSGLLPVKLPWVTAIISVSEPFVFAGTLVFGRSVGTLLVLLDALVISGKVTLAKKKFDWTKTPFNLAAPALSIWLASTVLFRISGPAPLALGDGWVGFVAGLGTFTILYFLLNSGFISLAIAIQRGHGPVDVLRHMRDAWWSMRELFLNYLAGASIAVLIVSGRGAQPNVSIKLLLVTLPVMVVLYLTYHNAAQRVLEMGRRLEAVEKVHMSTIAAFAMAIDAKDQVTHGHIRRVQRYVMALASALGVKDEIHLKAIEAAALLHDTGKLAVPEYILNKPGPLTSAEFEKMKEHAVVGANILKSIDFPYPVEPIVRHHHESWDGKGYPEGLKGSEIPLGARILSVVDCYDALTSDRPYRPRMTRAQAEQILRDRRGTTYDPWVVDAFLEILDHLESPTEVQVTSETRPTGSFSPLSVSQLDVITAATAEQREFAELRRDLLRASSVLGAAEVLFKHIRRVIPAATVVLFIPSNESTELFCAFCVGVGASVLETTKIPIGERVSGWAFAHRQMVINSDAALDLGPVARTFSVPLRYAVVAPLSDMNKVLGVITLYGADVFNKDHTRMLESAADLFSNSLIAERGSASVARAAADIDSRRVH